jgi:hypothetical protein
MGYFDPDGAAHEVILQRPGFADSDMLERASVDHGHAELAPAHESGNEREPLLEAVSKVRGGPVLMLCREPC